jgi:hypothetical protein
MIRIKVTWPLAIVLLALLALLLLRRPPQRRTPSPAPSSKPPRPRAQQRTRQARPTIIDGSAQESADPADREVADRARQAFDAAADSPFADALQVLRSRRHTRVHTNS